MRGEENGQLVFPDRMLNATRDAGLLFQLDRGARVASIANAASFDLQTKVFINFWKLLPWVSPAFIIGVLFGDALLFQQLRVPLFFDWSQYF